MEDRREGMITGAIFMLVCSLLIFVFTIKMNPSTQNKILLEKGIAEYNTTTGKFYIKECK